MSVKKKLTATAILVLVPIFSLVIYFQNHSVAVFQPRGIIGQKEKHLIIIALLLSSIVVIPVYIMLIGFAWRYRESNKKAKYQPELDGSRLFETIWWGVPLTIISILAVITFKSSHDLDPFKAIASTTKPMTIQVVSLQWKWLFIYPDQNVATVNFVQFPINTPIRFEITSDAPMNSFWIPQLGGQIYAMSGMATHLNLEASKSGSYYGTSANISGEGFAGMHFTAKATSRLGFEQWLKVVRSSPAKLSLNSYSQLSAPSQNDTISYYSVAQADLFNNIINKYESPFYLNPLTEAR